MRTINIIFPNQLFENSCLLNQKFSHYLIEEHLFLNNIISICKNLFSKMFMKNYLILLSKQLEIQYIESCNENSDIRKFVSNLDSKEIKEIVCFNPEDNYLERRIKESCDKKGFRVKFTTTNVLKQQRKFKNIFRSDKKIISNILL